MYDLIYRPWIKTLCVFSLAGPDEVKRQDTKVEYVSLAWETQINSVVYITIFIELQII